MVSGEDLSTLKHEVGIDSDGLQAMTASGLKDLVHGANETITVEGVR